MVFCGDFNSQGISGVRELLVAGKVDPDFRESGDPTEKGQEGKPITSKTKSNNFGLFVDAVEATVGAGNAPATILASNIDAKMVNPDGSATPQMLAALNEAFSQCCSQGNAAMSSADVEKFLRLVNGEYGRGSEFRFAQAVFERRGEQVLHADDFVALYVQELEQGKFWGVEHDLRVINGRGLSEPAEGACELRFDYVYC